MKMYDVEVLFDEEHIFISQESGSSDPNPMIVLSPEQIEFLCKWLSDAAKSFGPREFK